MAAGVIDLVHTLAFNGMPFFPSYGSNLAVSLWITARYLQSILILMAILLNKRRITRSFVNNLHYSANYIHQLEFLRALSNLLY